LRRTANAQKTNPSGCVVNAAVIGNFIFSYPALNELIITPLVCLSFASPISSHEIADAFLAHEPHFKFSTNGSPFGAIVLASASFSAHTKIES
jgi:hypothetical protein